MDDLLAVYITKLQDQEFELFWTGRLAFSEETDEKLLPRAYYRYLPDQAAFLERDSESIMSVIIMKKFDENTAPCWIITLSRKPNAVGFSSGLRVSGEKEFHTQRI